MAYSPICLPTKNILNKDFRDFVVKVSGYGYTEHKKHDDHIPNACELQVGINEVVRPEHEACQKVSRKCSLIRIYILLEFIMNVVY